MIVNDLGTMSYLNNTNQQGQNGSGMLMMLVVVFGGLALWQMMTPPPEEAPVAPVEIVQDTPAAPSAVDPSAPAVANNAVVVQPVRITSSFEGATVQFYITNVGGRVAAIHIVEPEQYTFDQGVHDLYPAVLECEANGVCKDQTNAVLSAQLPMSLRIPTIPELTETSVWAIDEEASQCQIQGDVKECSTLVMRWNSADGRLALTRSFEPEATAPYGLHSDLTIRNTTANRVVIGDVITTLYGGWSVPSGGILNQEASPTEVACFAEGKFRDRAAKKLEDVREYSKDVNYVAINGRYFLASLLPRSADGQPDTADRCVMKFAPRNAENTVALELWKTNVDVPPQSEISISHAYVAAPKRIEMLKMWNAELNQTVRFGMFAFLAVFIRWMLVFFHSLVSNWGVAIILLTIAIKILLLPVTAKSFQSMEKMKLISPKLEEIKKKYENDQQRLAQEQMKLFRDEGVNPLSGCLPMLLQMPIYFALYRTIYSSSELYQAPFLGWISDLTQRDPYFVLPILVSALMLAQVKFMPQAANTNPQMKMMQWLMPIMFIPVTLFLPAGLVLYIFVNIILSIVQQMYVRKRVEAAAAAPAPSKG